MRGEEKEDREMKENERNDKVGWKAIELMERRLHSGKTN